MGVADRQGGNVTRQQLLRLELHSRAIGRRVEEGWLIAGHAGVYSVGHRPRTHRERWWAAVLACGADAKTAAGTSAAAHALLDPHPRIHVTTPSKRSRPGIANHTAPTETVWIDGLPCCTVARTLLDLAGSVPPWTLERACRQAQTRGVLDLPELAALMLAFPRARGVRRLREILGDPVVMAPTRSRPERIALRALLADGWELPGVGVRVHGEELDFAFPRLRLGLEIDGPTHDTQVQRERDRRRDAKLAAQGWTIVRVPADEAANAAIALRRVVDLGRLPSKSDDSTSGRRRSEAA